MILFYRHMFFLMAQPEGGSNNMLIQLFPFIAIFFIFYFLLIRPQQKKQRDVQTMRENLKKGDKVITTGGIYGQIVNINDVTVTLKVDDKVKIQVAKVAVAGKQETEKTS